MCKMPVRLLFTKALRHKKGKAAPNRLLCLVVPRQAHMELGIPCDYGV